MARWQREFRERLILFYRAVQLAGRQVRVHLREPLEKFPN
jgi:hypothetical protein